MQIATWIIFILVYAGLGFGRFPRTKLDRAGIALVGCGTLFLFGILDFRDAITAIDFDTIVLLFSMMVIVIYLQMAGFFTIVSDWIAQRFSNPHSFLFAVIVFSGGLSAFLVNDVVCVAFTPLILRLCEKMKRPPVPYLLALATASNVGSVATITGNPQNVIIGSLSNISYLRFFARLGPIAVLGLILNFIVIAYVFRNQLKQTFHANVAHAKNRHHSNPVHPAILKRSLLVCSAVVIGFFFAHSLAATAFIGACGLLLVNIHPRKIYERVDWSLLLMFAGLFVVVHAFNTHVVKTWGLESWHPSASSPVVFLSLASTALSNLVSNVPAVLLLKPLVQVLPDPEQAWLTLAMSSTLAGNLTILGSVANLVVVENCRRDGIEISFWDYARVGVPITVLTLALGIIWLQFVTY